MEEEMCGARGREQKCIQLENLNETDIQKDACVYADGIQTTGK